MTDGIFAAPQALKADALDFLGDGFITLLRLLAIGWNSGWRARAAMLQELFSRLWPLGVRGTTLYRVFIDGTPEAGVIGVLGVLGVVALAVNACRRACRSRIAMATRTSVPSDCSAATTLSVTSGS